VKYVKNEELKVCSPIPRPPPSHWFLVVKWEDNLADYRRDRKDGRKGLTTCGYPIDQNSKKNRYLYLETILHIPHAGEWVVVQAKHKALSFHCDNFPAR